MNTDDKQNNEKRMKARESLANSRRKSPKAVLQLVDFGLQTVPNEQELQRAP